MYVAPLPSLLDVSEEHFGDFTRRPLEWNGGQTRVVLPEGVEASTREANLDAGIVGIMAADQVGAKRSIDDFHTLRGLSTTW